MLPEATSTDGFMEWGRLTIYAPMIYTAPCVMLLMHADTLRGGWALEIKSFLNPVKWHRAHMWALKR